MRGKTFVDFLRVLTDFQSLAEGKSCGGFCAMQKREKKIPTMIPTSGLCRLFSPLFYFCLMKMLIGVPESSHSSRILFSRNRLYGSFTYWGRFA